MKRYIAGIIVMAVLAFVFGCGGGGGGGTTGGSSTGSTVITDVAVFQNTNSPANLTQLSPGDTVQFQFTSTNLSTGATSPVSASSYSTNAPSTVAIISGTGLLTAEGPAPAGSNYKVTAIVDNTRYQFPLSVGSQAAKVMGTVQTTLTNGQVGDTINFYNASGTIVASAISGSDGSFLANVPATATSFNVGLNGSSAFYAIFYYGPLSYSSSILNCNVPLPTISVGTTTSLPNAVVLIPIDQNNPPLLQPDATHDSHLSRSPPSQVGPALA